MNMVYSSGALTQLRQLSDSLLTDTCTIYAIGSSDPTKPTMGNQGNVVKGITANYTNVPCRLDVNTNALLPQHNKDGVEAEKIMRFIYISLTYILNVMKYQPKSQDQLSSTAGNVLGNLTYYRILEIDTETDGVDCELLVEVIPALTVTV